MKPRPLRSLEDEVRRVKVIVGSLVLGKLSDKEAVLHRPDLSMRLKHDDKLGWRVDPSTVWSKKGLNFRQWDALVGNTQAA